MPFISRTVAVGRQAVLVEPADPAACTDLAGWLRERTPAHDVVPSAETVLVDGVEDVASLLTLLDDWRPGELSSAGELVEIPVHYDGPDLDDVAARWGTTPEQVVARHTSIDFVSRFCGFAPGFAYLSGLPDALAVPRLDSPRTSVPVGAVGLAGAWCGVYPTASPGGWRLLGRTDTALWDATREPPALLAPGTRVRFVRA
ncbi:MAG: 5-oxoprolinase subunit B family protein [Nocardioides sp.]